MYHDERDCLSPDKLCRELIDSIKMLDVRINELQMIVKSNPYGDDRRTGIVQRIERLIDTRFKLLFTLMDVTSENQMNPMSIFGKIGVDYNSFKRPIMTGKDVHHERMAEE